MASELLYLGILFTIALNCTYAQGYQGKEDLPTIKAGLALVPGPFRVIVPRKTSVLLNCSVDITDQSLHPLTYSWLKDGKQLDVNRQKSKVQLFSNGSLNLRPRRKSKGRNARKLDGVYECFVNTSKGIVLARRVEVVIASIARNFSHEPSPKEAYIGGVARFACEIRAEPRASYVWHKDDIQLPQDDKRFSYLPSGVLQISNIKESDAGSYWCQATPYLYTIQEEITNFRWKTSRMAELKINSDTSNRPPILLATPQNTSVIVGQTAILECFADGNPVPVIEWRKKDSAKILDGPMLNGHGNLQISQAGPKDVGVYECTVSSPSGTRKASAHLTVHVPPKLEQGPDSYSLPVSKVMTITCLVSGNPKPVINWYHNGIPVSETGGNLEYSKGVSGDLFLYTLQKHHSGFYQCVAENSVGQVMSVSLLTIVGKQNAPAKPENVRCNATSSTSFIVTWNHDPDELKKGLHPYVVAHKVVGENKFSNQAFCKATLCEIKDLMPYTNYSVTVQAFNTDGASDVSDKVYVQTLEDVPSHLPLIVSVSSLDPYTILVNWTSLLPAKSRGRVIAYRIYYRLAGKQDETFIRAAVKQTKETSYLIEGVEPDSMYEILVVAGTKVGFTQIYSDTIWFPYTTPAVDASGPPRFALIYVNASSVRLEWQVPVRSAMSSPEQSIIGYDIKLHSIGMNSEPLKEIAVPSSQNSYTFTGLDNSKYYEVTLIARTQQGPSSPKTRNFQLMKLREHLVPSKFEAKVNPDSVVLTWQAAPVVNAEYRVCYHKELDSSMMETCQTSNGTKVEITGLGAFTQYIFSIRVLINETEGNFSMNTIVRTLEDRPSPPMNLTVEVIKPGSVRLQWNPPAASNGAIKNYILMYSKQTSNPAEIKWKRITLQGSENSTPVDDLELSTYIFKLAATNEIGLSKYTDVVSILPTCYPGTAMPCKLEASGEGEPSSPVNLTALVIRPGSVRLQWNPPLVPNGAITYYIIMYREQTSTSDDSIWQSILLKGSVNSAQMDDLELSTYIFKLAATNKIGFSKPTDTVSILATCYPDIATPCNLEPIGEEATTQKTISGKSGGLTAEEIGFIVGGLIVISIIVILVVFIVLRCRVRRSRNDAVRNASSTPICPGNGHILTAAHHRPGNGHAHLISTTQGLGHVEMRTLESTPMLPQIPENEQSDSKGGDLLISPNGLRLNGIVKSQPKETSHIALSGSQGDLNSSNNSEELQGLMATMLASTDGTDVLFGGPGEKILSSLDDIDRVEDELGDHSSEDSGTGCRRAGMLGSRDAIHPSGSSPASSPGGSSGAHGNMGWDRGRLVDEIGGVLMDRSTGAVIGVVSSDQGRVSMNAVAEEEDEVGGERGRTCEDSAANDRDSGHGSEAKSQGGVFNSTGDNNNSLGLNIDVPASATPGDVQLSEEAVTRSLPVPPPPPPPPPTPPSNLPPSQLQLSSSTSSSQQLPCSSSRNLSSNNRPQTDGQHHHRYQRGTRHLSHTALPPPPPPPPMSANTLPLPQGPLAAVTESAAATAELNSSGSRIGTGGQRRSNESGSISSRQSESKAMVAFSPPRPPPSPPHIA